MPAISAIAGTSTAAAQGAQHTGGSQARRGSGLFPDACMRENVAWPGAKCEWTAAGRYSVTITFAWRRRELVGGRTGQGQGCLAASFWRRVLRRRSFSRSSGRSRARMLIASKAALIAPALPMASVPDRHAGRHLHGGQQCVEPVQVRADERHAEHRPGGMGRDRAGQVGRHPRRRDEDLRARRVAFSDVLGGLVGRAMGRQAPALRTKRRTPRSVSTAAFITSQSLWLPSKTATSRCRGHGFASPAGCLNRGQFHYNTAELL